MEQSTTVRFEQTMRWYGPNDPVSLADIRQAGAEGVVSALHHIAPGEVWPLAEIERYKAAIKAAGLTWPVVESLPVSEEIKTRRGDYRRHIENYKESLRNLAAARVPVVTYNFMPVLDWTRTNVAYELPDGSRALRFERAAFVAFDLYVLRREGAERDYSWEEVRRAEERYARMTSEEVETLTASVLMGLPGADESFSLENIRAGLELYRDITDAALREHLVLFLREVAPVADEVGDPSGRPAVSIVGAPPHHELCRGLRTAGRSGAEPLERTLLLHGVAQHPTRQRPAGHGRTIRWRRSHPFCPPPKHRTGCARKLLRG